jgi:hypothetical protein
MREKGNDGRVDYPITSPVARGMRQAQVSLLEEDVCQFTVLRPTNTLCTCGTTKYMQVCTDYAVYPNPDQPWTSCEHMQRANIRSIRSNEVRDLL